MDTGISNRNLIRRHPIENLDMTDKQLLSFYYYIRAKEATKNWNQATFDYEVNYMFGVHRSHGIIPALKYIDEKTTITHQRKGNPSNRYRIEGKNRIYDNPNSTKGTGRFKYDLYKY